VKVIFATFLHHAPSPDSSGTPKQKNGVFVGGLGRPKKPANQPNKNAFFCEVYSEWLD
jgi:hypothetical protein